MKVIDLLNKIANGEEVPKKICYLPYETNNEYAGNYTYKDDDYLKDGWNNVWLFNKKLFHTLNDEIEIIDDEPKKLEKIKWNEKSSYNTAKEEIPMLMSRTEQLKKALSEIIDYINKGEK